MPETTRALVSDCGTVVMNARNRLRARPYRLSLAGKKGKNRVGDFGADGCGELFACRPPYRGEAAKTRQQGAPPTRTDAGHVIELRTQIAHRSRLAMERHGEAVGFVAHALE